MNFFFFFLLHNNQLLVIWTEQGVGEIVNSLSERWVLVRMERNWTFIHHWWKCKIVQPLWNSLAVLQKVKQRVTTWPTNSAPRYMYIPKRNKNICLYTKPFTWTFIAVLFIVAKKWKQSKYPPTDEWMKKNVVYSYNVILFSNKRNKVLIHATKWMNFEKNVLSERSWSHSTMYYMIQFIWNAQNRQIYRDRK